MRLETFPSKPISSISKKEKVVPVSPSQQEVTSWDNVETFQDIKDNFGHFAHQYFSAFEKLTNIRNPASITKQAEKLHELTRSRRTFYARINEAVQNCPEAQTMQAISPKTDSADIHVSEADAIKAKADLFDSLCSYAESISGRVRQIEDGYSQVASRSDNQYKKANNNEINIVRVQHLQTICQAIIRSPKENNALFQKYLSEAKKAYNLSEAECRGLEKAVLGTVGGYFHYRREKKVIFPTAITDATFKTDLYLVDENISEEDEEKLNKTNFSAPEIIKLPAAQRALVENLQLKCNDGIDKSTEIRYKNKSGECEINSLSSGKKVNKYITSDISDAANYLPPGEREEAKIFLKDFCQGLQMNGRFTVFSMRDAEASLKEA